MSVTNVLTANAVKTGEELPTNMPNRTFQATLKGVGVCNAIVAIEYSNDCVVWFPLPDSPKTVTTVASGTNPVVASVIFDIVNAGWAFVRAKCTAISGTNAEVSVTMGMM